MDCFDRKDAIALLYLKKKYFFSQSRTTVIFMIDEKV